MTEKNNSSKSSPNLENMKTEKTNSKRENIIFNSYLKDPRYDDFLTHFQRGEWGEANQIIDVLIQQYPREDELHLLKNDLKIQISLDVNENDDIALDKTRRNKKIVTRIALLMISIIAISFIYQQTSSWLQEQAEIAENNIKQSLLEISLSTRLQNSKSLIQGDKFADALTVLESIRNEAPSYEGLEEALMQAETLVATKGLYDQAMALISAGDGLEALEVLREIAEDAPFFLDIETQIRVLEKDYELGQLLADGDVAYDNEKWITAIDYYEAAIAIEITDDVEDKLFSSYIHGSEFILISAELSLEDLTLAEGYFRSSLALKPQNREALNQRANISASIAGLLSAGYIRAAQSFLADNSGSLDALDNASIYFGKALAINPDAAEIRLQFNLARSYLLAESKFRNGAWTEAIDKLVYVYATDTNYANRTAEQMLYEAYGARGNTYLAIGDFNAAIADFQQAVFIAQSDRDSVLRLFEAQVNLAYSLGRLGNHRDAVNLYEVAIDESNFYDQLDIEDDAGLLQALLDGERAATRRDYRAAYVWYSDALRGNTDVYQLIRHTVEQDEYLSQLARKYFSTVQAIIEANNLVYPYYLLPGQILLIPTIK